MASCEYDKCAVRCPLQPSCRRVPPSPARKPRQIRAIRFRHEVRNLQSGRALASIVCIETLYAVQFRRYETRRRQVTLESPAGPRPIVPEIVSTPVGGCVILRTGRYSYPTVELSCPISLSHCGAILPSQLLILGPTSCGDICQSQEARVHLSMSWVRAQTQCHDLPQSSQFTISHENIAHSNRTPVVCCCCNVGEKRKQGGKEYE